MPLRLLGKMYLITFKVGVNLIHANKNKGQPKGFAGSEE